MDLKEYPGATAGEPGPVRLSPGGPLYPRKRTFNLRNLVKASSFKLTPRVVQRTLLWPLGVARRDPGALFLVVRGLGLLITLHALICGL